MSVRLRLRREGGKKNPHYRIVAADQRSPRDGRFIEIIGTYDPQQNPSRVEVDGDRALYWLRNGAQPTEQVENLLHITGVWEQFKPDEAAAKVQRAENRATKAKQKADDEASQKGKSEPTAPPPDAADAPAVDDTEPPAPAAESEAAAGEDTPTAETTAEGEAG